MKLLRCLRYNWITIWLAIIIFSLATVVSYAAYTGTTTTKRVISLSSTDGILFSSRYMFKAGTDMQPIVFSYPDDEVPTVPPTTIIDVCNYDANENIYDKNFNFKLKAKLVQLDKSDITNWDSNNPPTEDYKIKYISHTGSASHTYVENELTLTNEFQYIGGNNPVQYFCQGSDKTRYLFQIQYPLTDITNTSMYGVMIYAELSGQPSGIQDIWGMLYALKGGAAEKTKWEGKFMDDIIENLPSDYDAINYQLSGNTAGTVTLKYYSKFIQIDKECYGLWGDNVTEVEDGAADYTTLSIEVDADVDDMYNLRFYWVKKPAETDDLQFDDNLIETSFT